MKKLTVWAFIAALPGLAFGQQALSVKRPVTRTIDPGHTDSFTVTLRDGDYARFSLTQHGRVDILSANPDGTPLGRSPGRGSGATRSFALAAEGSGQYQISVRNPGRDAVGYELALETITPLSARLRADAWHDSLVSPRIEALRREIASGHANTDSFWSEVREQGTPLAEPFAPDSSYQLVTFLWRAIHDTRNVLVTGSFAYPVSPFDLAMHRLGNSDVWYLTLKLPTGSRFTYSLSPNDPMTWDGPRADERDATQQMDPLNPHRLRCPPGAGKLTCESVAELPHAPPQPWLVSKPETPQGRLEAATITSRIQNLDRGLSVYTPANYDAAGPPNALLVLFDGPLYLLPEQGTLTTLNELIAASKIPPTVVVFVNNVGNRRVTDLIANSKFADFVTGELVPWIRSHYNVTRNPARTVVGGYSASGFAAAYVAMRHSELFGNVISQSGAFWWAPDHNGGFCGPDCTEAGYTSDRPMDATTEPNWMARQFIASPRLPIRFYLDAGTFEVDLWGKGGDILEPTRHLRDVLLAKGYDVHYQQVASGHDGLNWRGTIADALIVLLGPL